MNVFATYKKALKVIDTSETIYHLKGARRFVNLFFESHSKFVGKNRYNFREFVTDRLVEEMYSRLLMKLVTKEIELGK